MHQSKPVVITAIQLR